MQASTANSAVLRVQVSKSNVTLTERLSWFAWGWQRAQPVLQVQRIAG